MSSVNGPRQPPHILGIAEDVRPGALSGIPDQLLGALDASFPVQRLGYGPSGLARFALAGATFRPSTQDWRSRFHTSALANRVLSRTLATRMARVEGGFDVMVQVFGWVSGQMRPYVLYVDQTRLMAERGWPPWMPLGRRERSAVLQREREMYRGASHIFTMGGECSESLAAEYGVESARVTVAGGGMSFESMPAERVLPRDPIILFVGKEFERKGGPCLIRAFERVRRAVPTAELHLVGPRRKLDGPGIFSQGRIADRERLADLYRRARVFCLPSHYEPYGLVLLEAMAHQVPCVGTTVQSIPEILGDGDAGILVRPGNSDALAEALLTLLSDDDLASRLGAAGRRRVERDLTWARVAERMAPAIVDAAGEGARC